MREFSRNIWAAGTLWYEKDATGIAATVSYYAIFAISPLLLLTITLTSIFYGRDYVVSIFQEWGSILGTDLVALLQQAVLNLETISSGIQIPMLGIIFFSFMVIVMFNALTSGLHQLWGISHQGFRGWIRKSTRSLVFVVLLEVYLVFLIGLDKYGDVVSQQGDFLWVFLLQAIVTLFTTMVFFSLVYRVLPRKCPALTSRLMGGFVAAILFLIAKSFVSWYIGTTPVPGLFGAAGLIVVLLIWVYVSVAVVYFGAAYAWVVDDTMKISENTD